MAHLHRDGTVTMNGKDVVGYWAEIAHRSTRGRWKTLWQGYLSGRTDSPEFHKRRELVEWLDAQHKGGGE